MALAPDKNLYCSGSRGWNMPSVEPRRINSKTLMWAGTVVSIVAIVLVELVPAWYQALKAKVARRPQRVTMPGKEMVPPDLRKG